jgi:CBS-domain-containing membrane protein
MSQHPLATTHLPPETCIAMAEPPRVPTVDLGSPGIAVMTDLTQVRAATVHPEDSLIQAEQVMIHQGVRTLFVVSKLPCIDGIVASRDLSGEAPLRLMRERNAHREDLRVRDLMRPLADLDAVDLETLARATVGDVSATLARFGHPYLLVLEAAGREHPARIRGLISQAQLERQLGRAIPTVEVATTFDEVRRALA